jgi:cytochrome o ubiquinol oxidase subunit II
MNNKYKSYFLVVLSIGLMLLLSGCEMAVLDPKGFVASEEKRLIIIATLLMLIVVIPVIVLTVVFAWKYRATNTKAIYTPNWEHNTLLEVIWWAIPCVIIVILATITWITSHKLDPYKPLDVKAKPITIEVVALDWKWLFIYPEQNIATVNFIQFPDHVPINFKITADAPMNSFWIPHLGGQIYAMAGMQTKLHLIADERGEYAGLSSNYSGAGFSWMKFTAKVGSEDEFNQWVDSVKHSPNRLTNEEYDQLAKPSENNSVKEYSFVEPGLYNGIIMKFMVPATADHNGHIMMDNEKHP